MSSAANINRSTLKVVKDDLTAMATEALVYYARPDLVLGSGTGNAIAQRGGPSIQQELEGKGPLEVGQCVVTAGGELQAQKVIHAVGPRFQEEGAAAKLKQTVTNALQAADEAGVKQVALPPMGAGFYGIPLAECRDIMLEAIVAYLKGQTSLKEVTIVAMDGRELAPFEDGMRNLQ